MKIIFDLKHLAQNNFYLPGFVMFTLWLPAAGSSLALVLVMLAVVLQAQMRQRLLQTMRHPLIWGAVALWLLLGLTSTYSITPFDSDLDRLLKYKEFLWLPLFATLCRGEHDKKQAMTGFLLGATLVIMLSYANYFQWTTYLPDTIYDRISPQTDDGPVVFKLAITHNFLMALAACAFFVVGLKTPGRRPLYWSLGILALVNVVAMVGGRTGYLVLIAAFLYLFFLRFGYKGLLLGVIASLPLCLLTYNSVPKLQQAVDEGMTEVRRWIEQPTVAEPTGSMEMRLNWWLASVEAIAERPLLGYGVGGYSQAYAKLRSPQEYPPNENPHNQFLLFAIEGGLIWLTLFAAWWLALWHYATKQIVNHDSKGGEYFQIFQVTWLAFGLACVVNSFFLDHTEGILIQAFTGLFLLGNVNQQRKKAWLD